MFVVQLSCHYLSLTANVQHLARINNLHLKLKLADEILNLSF